LSILRPNGISYGHFGTFLSHLVHFSPFWYIVPRKIWQPRCPQLPVQGDVPVRQRLDRLLLHLHVVLGSVSWCSNESVYRGSIYKKIIKILQVDSRKLQCYKLCSLKHRANACCCFWKMIWWMYIKILLYRRRCRYDDFIYHFNTQTIPIKRRIHNSIAMFSLKTLYPGGIRNRVFWFWRGYNVHGATQPGHHWLFPKCF
jgi:hypothetical protein